MSKYCIGIDLGGTFMKLGLLDRELKIKSLVQVPTPQDKGSKGVMDAMAQAAKDLMSDNGLTTKDVAGIGIGAPGPLKISEGIVIGMPNIPGMNDVHIRDIIAERVGVQTTLENDANAAAYGEYLCGAGKGKEDIVLLTLGTGVGSGIIIGGKIVHGAHEIGAELGHLIVEPGGELCGCGQLGCLERYCSAHFLALRAQRMIEAGHQSSLKDVLKKTGAITSQDICYARRAGDSLATMLWDRAAYYLALGCVSIARVLDPDEIVLAGGLSKAGDDLIEPVSRYFRDLHWTLTKPLAKISISTLKNDAGAIGAAGVAWSIFGK